MPAASGEKITTTPMESLARFEIFSDAKTPQDNWRIVFWFETGNYDDKGALVGDPVFGTRNVQRSFDQIKDDPDVLKAMGIIKAKAYQYREENIARAAEQEAERVAITQQSTVAS